MISSESLIQLPKMRRTDGDAGLEEESAGWGLPGRKQAGSLGMALP